MLGLGLALVSAACIEREPFACDADVQCEAPGRPGQCVEPGFCAHPDETCPSGLRYGRFADAPLVNKCTMLAVGSSSTAGSSSSGFGSGSSSSSSSSGEPIPLEECDGVDNDQDGLVDEWSEVNEQCNGCDLFQNEGRTYWRCSNDRWTDVQSMCEGFGANLASIQDADENLYLTLRTRPGQLDRDQRHRRRGQLHVGRRGAPALHQLVGRYPTGGQHGFELRGNRYSRGVDHLQLPQLAAGILRGATARLNRAISVEAGTGAVRLVSLE